MATILITLCARGGSKGIPGKNIKLLNNKPLIVYSLDVARQFADTHKASIALSTDSEEIKSVCASYGLPTTYHRPAALATDTAGKIGVIKDVLLYEEQRQSTTFDFVIDLDITSPLRTATDIEKCLALIVEDDQSLTAFSVNKANRNPYFNMVEKKADGYVTLVKKLESNLLTRQSAPLVYDLNASIYAYKRQFFDLNLNTPITDRSLIYEMPHLCFDLDHPIDFEFLSFLVAADKLDFFK